MRWFSFLCFFLSPLVALAESQASASAELLTDHDVYLSDVANTTFMEARFFGTEIGSNASASTRNIAFVLDRSGSMAGSRIESLRKAVSVAILALSKDDIISVVFSVPKSKPSSKPNVAISCKTSMRSSLKSIPRAARRSTTL